MVVTFAGGGAFFPIPGAALSAYAAAKAGVCRLTDQLQAELLETAIDVNAVEPGRVPAGDTAAAAPAVAAVRCLATAPPGRIRGRILAAHDTWWRDPARVAEVAASDAAFRLRRDESLG